MKKNTHVAKAKSDGLAPLIVEVRRLIQSARRGVASVVDTFQVMTNFEIGRRIVEHEQKGETRAAYGAELLKELSAQLTKEFGKGFSPVNLSHMRRFFLTWRERLQIFQQPTEKLLIAEKSQQVNGKPAPAHIWQHPAVISQSPFTLSCTHYVLLLTIKYRFGMFDITTQYPGQHIGKIVFLPGTPV